MKCIALIVAALATLATAEPSYGHGYGYSTHSVGYPTYGHGGQGYGGYSSGYGHGGNSYGGHYLHKRSAEPSYGYGSPSYSYGHAFSRSVLAHFDPNLPITLLTDASRLRRIGFAILQMHSDGSTILIQSLAIQWDILKGRTYLFGNSKIQRILQKLAGYCFDIEWISGKEHQIEKIIKTIRRTI
ncbi:unnamed protein product [Lepeophtheirus salmonis]|uniref:(salmon louse) hypothetical protein n=1 Tax=Lepeophtheirus salmonis TaxID=72036 RepID=A0A7R8CBX5_LEPSM|nr:unnamed protein product [Lepeophtheirus salmonis]CAF2763514.1 unnamed protein product [Lepeophtheirus salmonis]